MQTNLATDMSLVCVVERGRKSIIGIIDTMTIGNIKLAIFNETILDFFLIFFLSIYFHNNTGSLWFCLKFIIASLTQMKK